MSHPEPSEGTTGTSELPEAILCLSLTIVLVVLALFLLYLSFLPTSLPPF